MDDDIKAALTDLRLHSQADVQRMWDLLMRPLGVGSQALWVCLVDDRDAPIPLLTEITGHEDVPTELEIAKLFETLVLLRGEERDVSSVAFLISHPGRGGLNDCDRLFAARLTAAARASGVPCHPIHVANDDGLVPVSADDLAA